MDFDGNLITLRPFTKVVNFAAFTSGIVELRDSVGSSIPCNYISVSPGAASNGTGYFQVFLSGIGETAPISGAPSSAPNTSRGSVGIGGGSIYPVEFNLDYGNECNAIAIHSAYNTATSFSINYGVKKPMRNKMILEVKPNLGAK